ncbi:redoxin domain-containing protein [Candidatus Bipolaricaulota bacterium]|nr:redoxin domain-containing protein [Candidatus Bipolaricaulota bacterium]
MDEMSIGRTARAIAFVALLGILLATLAACLSPTGPIAILGAGSISGSAPFAAEFDLSHCAHPQELPMSFRLDFGDDSDPQVGTSFGIIVHHTYETPGAYTARLMVTDDQGEAALDSLTITVGDDGPTIGIEVGMRAPNLTGSTTDGGEFTLYDALGQVVLLDFWGAWCAPCKRSLPHLDELAETYEAQGMIAVLVSTDGVEQDTIDYLTQNAFTRFVSIWEPGGKYTPIATLYGVLSGGDVGIPHTFLLDRQGVIRYAGHPMYLTPALIEPLL